jgi:hypothetical protein
VPQSPPSSDRPLSGWAIRVVTIAYSTGPQAIARRGKVGRWHRGSVAGRKRAPATGWKHDRSQEEITLYCLAYRRLKGSEYFPGSGCPELASRCGRCRINLRSWCWCQECRSMRSAEQRSKIEYIELHHDLASPRWVTICYAQGFTCARHPAMPHRPQW